MKKSEVLAKEKDEEEFDFEKDFEHVMLCHFFAKMRYWHCKKLIENSNKI